jgi:hypothetical protein
VVEGQHDIGQPLVPAALQRLEHGALHLACGVSESRQDRQERSRPTHQITKVVHVLAQQGGERHLERELGLLVGRQLRKRCVGQVREACLIVLGRWSLTLRRGDKTHEN